MHRGHWTWLSTVALLLGAGCSPSDEQESASVTDQTDKEHTVSVAEQEFDAGTVAQRLLRYIAGLPGAGAGRDSIAPLYAELQAHWAHTSKHVPATADGQE